MCWLSPVADGDLWLDATTRYHESTTHVTTLGRDPHSEFGFYCIPALSHHPKDEESWGLVIVNWDHQQQRLCGLNNRHFLSSGGCKSKIKGQQAWFLLTSFSVACQGQSLCAHWVSVSWLLLIRNSQDAPPLTNGLRKCGIYIQWNFMQP
jgi:hypothetical protein